MQKIKSSSVAVKKVLAAVMAIGVFAAATPGAQAAPNDSERIQFSKDIIEVNLEKTVLANGAKRFVFNAKAGQEIALTVTPKVKGATLLIDLNGKTVTPGKLYSLKVNKGRAVIERLVSKNRSRALP